jgi:hypothetical protein
MAVARLRHGGVAASPPAQQKESVSAEVRAVERQPGGCASEADDLLFPGSEWRVFTEVAGVMGHP